jgi:hypothetical protein
LVNGGSQKSRDSQQLGSKELVNIGQWSCAGLRRLLRIFWGVLLGGRRLLRSRPTRERDMPEGAPDIGGTWTRRCQRLISAATNLLFWRQLVLRVASFWPGAAAASTFTHMKRPVAILLGFAALATGAVAVAEAEDALLKRYPYDPACAWGRVGNGKGMVVRCISEDEAKSLRAAPTTPVAAAKPAPVASPGVSSAKPTPDAAPTPGSTPAETAPDIAAEPEPAPGSEADAALDVVVGPVKADEGTLGIGKLGAPKDKYTACVQKNGGLSGKTGEVSVRFLVRAKGVAEGVSVDKRTNLSKEAAQCVAEVVDRRRVGTPESAMVGATVLVKFTKLDKLPK